MLFRFLLLFASALPIALSISLSIAVPATASDDDNAPDWQVSEPPGPWRTINIDTETSTWSFVDVSPDGKTVVFDMLG